MTPSGPPAVTFDLWHTLVYLTPRAEEVYMRRQRELAVEVLAEAEPLPGRPRRSPRSLGAAFDTERLGAVAAANRGRTITVSRQFERAAARVGRAARPEAYLARLGAELARTEFRRAPGALPVLEALRHEGYRVGVISNTVGEPGSLLRPMMRRMGFDGHIDRYVFSDEQPWTKPSAAIFWAALRSLGSRPSRAVHVGDGWSDVEGARRARLRAGVLFEGLRHYGPSYRRLFGSSSVDGLGARYSLDRLDELPHLLRELLPPR